MLTSTRGVRNSYNLRTLFPKSQSARKRRRLEIAGADPTQAGYYRLKSLFNKEKLAGENEKQQLQQFSMTRGGTHTNEHLIDELPSHSKVLTLIKVSYSGVVHTHTHTHTRTLFYIFLLNNRTEQLCLTMLDAVTGTYRAAITLD